MRSLVEFDPDIHELLEEVEEAANVEKAIYLIRDGFGLANVTYHFAASGHSAWDAPFVRTTYPELWVARYLMKGCFPFDPGRRLTYDPIADHRPGIFRDHLPTLDQMSMRHSGAKLAAYRRWRSSHRSGGCQPRAIRP